MWKRRKKSDIEDQLYLFQIFGIIVTAALCLVLTIFVTIGRSNSQQTDRLFPGVNRHCKGCACGGGAGA